MDDAKLVPFDASEFLDSDEAIRDFLEDILESNDAKVIAAGLGDVARARGMTQIAKDAGMSRESLYRALSADGNPQLETVLKVMRALGFSLSVSRQHPDAAE